MAVSVISYRLKLSFDSESTKNKIIKMLMINKTGEIKPLGNDLSLLMITGEARWVKAELVSTGPSSLFLQFRGLSDLDAPRSLEPFDGPIWDIARFLDDLPGVHTDYWSCSTKIEFVMFNTGAYWKDRLCGTYPEGYKEDFEDDYSPVIVERLEAYDGRVFYKGRDTLGTPMTATNHHWLLTLPRITIKRDGAVRVYPEVTIGSVCSEDYDNYSVPNLSKYMKE